MYIFHLRMNIFLFFKNKVSSRVGDQPPALHADHLRRGDPADPAVHSDSRGFITTSQLPKRIMSLSFLYIFSQES